MNAIILGIIAKNDENSCMRMFYSLIFGHAFRSIIHINRHILLCPVYDADIVKAKRHSMRLNYMPYFIWCFCMLPSENDKAKLITGDDIVDDT